jgi:ERF superfamily
MTDEPTNLPTAPTTPLEMVARAVNMGATPDTLERLLAMQERWEKNEARKAFNQAIAKARGEIKPIFKSSEVRMGAGRPAYRYETLDDIEREVVPALSKHGLSYRWGTKVPETRPDMIIVTCRVEHKDGWFEENSLAGPTDTSGAKNPIQAVGSALTYLCRYSLKAALGLSATTDDDGADLRELEELVTEMELAQLKRRIEEVGQTESRVCDYYGIVRLEDLPRSKFERVMKKLDASARQK